MSKDLRLLDFNVYDGSMEETESSDSEDTGKPGKQFIVECFGIDQHGESICIMISGYKPFFYAKVPDNWTESECFMLRDILRQGMTFMKDTLIDIRIVRRKKLYGFDGGKYHCFACMTFQSEAGFNRAKNLWYTRNRNGERALIKGGLTVGEDKLPLYEAHIPPLLRLFHIKEISPSGWIGIPLTKAIERDDEEKRSTCKREFVIDYKDVKALHDKETPVPYKVMSFDIEASSSHGDFPLPIKDYRKLAENIASYMDDSGEITIFELRSLITGAFGYGNFATSEKVDRIYTTPVPSEKKINDMIDKWLNTILSKKDDKQEGYKGVISFLYKNAKAKFTTEEDCDDGSDSETESCLTTHIGHKSEGKTILEYLNDSKVLRIEKVTKMVNLFRLSGFPKVLGDKVTFIGSTFKKAGQEKPYLNHCIVLGTCDVPEGENVVIESYKRESDVLMAWTELVQREDPDMIIGYNIFGFDYEFMFRRAVECGCAEPFLVLSRLKGKMCGKLVKDDEGNQELDIEKQSVTVASGQHDFHFIKMEGRIQIDLLNYFRREYNLNSYKLDSVANEFIGDNVKTIQQEDNKTIIHSKNLVGLEVGNYVVFEEISHSSDMYKGGAKFMVESVDPENSNFSVSALISPDMRKKVRWGLAKDDVSPQDIFRLTNGTSADRSIIAKYCLQDCNLLHHLVKKIDVITGLSEMSRISSVPMSFVVFRGQGIKLTSYLAKKCRELGYLKPTIDKGNPDDVLEGAIVLEPKVGFYDDNPVACLDYASLYPSEMIADNISHDSKVWTKTYDLNGRLVSEEGEKDAKGNYKYDNLENYEYVNIEYDHIVWRNAIDKNGNPKKAVKTPIGKKVCRFAQFPDGDVGVLPSILRELLSQRKATRKESAKMMATDPQFANVLDKRQLSYKILANSIYGQTGAKTSSFYEVDIASSTTAGGRKMLMYAKKVLETAYTNREFDVPGYGKVVTNGEYVYGDTDSVFFTFNLSETNGTPIRGQRALELTILLAQDAGVMASSFLKAPHDLEYEKTFLPFCLLSKKRYVGMLYETDPKKCFRKSMGIVLKRRDNAPVVKDVFGGVIDKLMSGEGMDKAVEFTKESINQLVEQKVPIEKLLITKSLRSNYAKPKQIAHKVLADRIAVRDPGNKLAPGSRIAFAYIVNMKSKSQGERIETPEYIRQNNVKLDYSHYITNQIMKPVSQVLGLCIEDLPVFKRKRDAFLCQIDTLRNTISDGEKLRKMEQKIRDSEVKTLVFDYYIKQAENMRCNQRSLIDMWC